MSDKTEPPRMHDKDYNGLTMAICATFIGIMVALLSLFILAEHAVERRHEEMMKAITSKYSALGNGATIAIAKSRYYRAQQDTQNAALIIGACNGYTLRC